MSFAKWLRSNSEHYLLRDAQLRTARDLGIDTSVRVRGPKDMFWMWFFVPVYRCLPWGVRRGVMQLLPGSHRRAWPRKNWRGPV